MSDDIQKQRRKKLERDFMGRESVDSQFMWTQKEDFSVFDKPEQSSVRMSESFGVNKLSALNEMLKKKDFQLSNEDEDDFESFLTRLGQKR